MRDVPELTRNDWPVSAFSGVTLSAGVVKRGSRQVPVHSTGSCARRSACPCRRRACGPGVLGPSALGSQRVFQKPSLPVKNARLTPASRAASIARALAGGPVLVVAAGDEQVVVWSSWPRRCTSTLADVAHVVAVGLEEADHRVLAAGEQRRPPVVLGRVERAVVGDLVRALVARGVAGRARDRRSCRGCCRRRCCRPARSCRRSAARRPSRSRRRGRRSDVAVAAGVVAHEVRDVDAGHGRASGRSTTRETASCRSRSGRCRRTSGSGRLRRGARSARGSCAISRAPSPP